jgi:hypothetical protein
MSVGSSESHSTCMEISCFFFLLFFLTTLAVPVTAASTNLSSKYFLGKGSFFFFPFNNIVVEH